MWPDVRDQWGKAEKYCNDRKGHLASVPNMETHNYIKSRVKSSDEKTHFWIGGTDKRHEGNWTWTDGSPWNFTKWGTTPNKQPDNFINEDCLQIYSGFSTDGWNDRECAFHRRFVCSRHICEEINTSTNDSNDTSNTSTTIKPPDADTNSSMIKNNTSSNSNILVIALAACSAVFFIIVIIIVIGYLKCKSKKDRVVKGDEVNADENPVYGIYQLGEAYERQYSTNEVVDNNVYYE